MNAQERSVFASFRDDAWRVVALSCPLCDTHYLDRDGLRQHLRRTHKASPSRRQSYRSKRVKSPRSQLRKVGNKR